MWRAGVTVGRLIMSCSTSTEDQHLSRSSEVPIPESAARSLAKCWITLPMRSNSGPRNAFGSSPPASTVVSMHWKQKSEVLCRTRKRILNNTGKWSSASKKRVRCGCFSWPIRFLESCAVSSSFSTSTCRGSRCSALKFVSMKETALACWCRGLLVGPHKRKIERLSVHRGNGRLRKYWLVSRRKTHSTPEPLSIDWLRRLRNGPDSQSSLVPAKHMDLFAFAFGYRGKRR